jgi:DNA-binding LytR/AlgR family response regulator
MITMNCVAVDDSRVALDLLVNRIRETNGLNLLHEDTDPYTVLKLIQEDQIKPDLLFLDIQMPGCNGIAFVEELKMGGHIPLVIYTTAHRNYGPEAIEKDAVAYLLKPIKQDKFNEAVLKARGKWEENLRSLRPEIIFVPGNGKIDRLKIIVDDIIYVKAYRNYTDIFTKDNKHTTFLTLKVIEEMLPFPWFVRVHRSYLICVAKVERANAFTITMENGVKIKIGGITYRPKLAGLFNQPHSA